MIYLYKITACIAFAAAFLHYLHMFQLNSYKIHDQIKWIKKNFLNDILKRNIFAIISLIFVLFPEKFLFGGIVSNIIYLLINFPRKAKKPLVFTARIKRMIASATIIVGIVFALESFFYENFKIALITVPIVLSVPYFFVLISNFANSPIENAIKRHYIDEAKKIISTMPNLIVIGITGSYGKTSTKFFLEKVLSSKYNVLMTPESYNTTMGVVKTIRENLKASHEIFICEMGAKDKGHIKEICDIVNPNYGIITSIGPQHLESFKTIENIIKTKFELCDSLPSDGVIFLNGDNEYVRKNKIDKNAVYYGIENNGTNTFYAKDIEVCESGTKFTVCENGKDYKLYTRLIGKHNVVNIIGCVAVARQLKIEFSDIMLSCIRILPVPHRLEVKGSYEFTILDDAFNSNPSGSEAALEVLGEFSGFKILITPGMVELGVKEAECNKEFGKNAAGVCDYVILVGRKISKYIEIGLEESNYPKEKYKIFNNFTESLEFAKTINSNGQNKIVLIENDLPDNF